MTETSAMLLAFPERDEDRLRLALRKLVAALDAQADAVAAWRNELGGLAGAVGGLQGSLTRYQAALGSTAEDLRQAGDQARSLEQTAEGWLTAAQG